MVECKDLIIAYNYRADKVQKVGLSSRVECGIAEQLLTYGQMVEYRLKFLLYCLVYGLSYKQSVRGRR